MDTWTVGGGLAGYLNPGADETTRTDRFDETFTDYAAAEARARHLCLQLRRGGIVLLTRVPAGAEFLDLGEEVATAARAVESDDWYISGVDLRAS